MTTQNKIINGKFYSEKLLLYLKKKIINSTIKPKLVIIIVGNDFASQIYIKNKERQAKAIGVEVEVVPCPKAISQDELEGIIHNINNDINIHALIVQLPLPDHIDKNKIISLISPIKDVDGLNPINMGKLYLGLNVDLISCTALSCLHLIKTVISDFVGKHVVIINQSIIVGRPIAALLLQYKCTITMCNFYTKNLSSICKQADVLISGIGVPKYINEDFCKKNSIIIDVGISHDKKCVVGDVDLDNVFPHIGYITPVPGGVGPMTIAFLLYNTVKASKINCDDFVI